jgi:HSP20 family molecular chaperone IbpA
MTSHRPSHDEVVASRSEAARMMQPQWVPVNAYETPAAFVVIAPTPAVVASDMTVELTREQVRFSSSLRSSGPRQYVLHEWEYGGYDRSVEVPAGFGAGLEASLLHGQLVIRVLAGDHDGDQRIHPVAATVGDGDRHGHDRQQDGARSSQ